MALDGVYLHISGFDQFDKLDFDKREIRKSMVKVGRLIQKTARKKVAGGPSAAGDYPGKGSGRLQRSIKSRVSRSGFMVKVAPDKVDGMTGFYPAYLWYGVRRGVRRGKGHRARQAVGSWRVAPRANYMVDALAERQSDVKTLLGDGLARGLHIR